MVLVDISQSTEEWGWDCALVVGGTVGVTVVMRWGGEELESKVGGVVGVSVVGVRGEPEAGRVGG